MPSRRRPQPLLVPVVVLGLMLHSASFCARVGLVAQGVATGLVGLFGKPPATGWDRATLKFRDRTVRLLKARWIWISATTLISHFSLFAVLLVGIGALTRRFEQPWTGASAGGRALAGVLAAAFSLYAFAVV